MASENRKWDELVALRDELDRPNVVVPIRRSRLGGTTSELSPKAMRFAEALAFSDGWARIPRGRDRRMAA